MHSSIRNWAHISFLPAAASSYVRMLSAHVQCERAQFSSSSYRHERKKARRRKCVTVRNRYISIPDSLLLAVSKGGKRGGSESRRRFENRMQGFLFLPLPP